MDRRQFLKTVGLASVTARAVSAQIDLWAEAGQILRRISPPRFPDRWCRTSVRRSTARLPGFDVPAWDISCFYFHDALVQTSADNPAVQRADHRTATTRATFSSDCA
jgi:hypothetical protein